MAADIIVGAIIAVLAGLSIYKIVKDRRSGAHSCGYSCSGCPHHGKCGH